MLIEIRRDVLALVSLFGLFRDAFECCELDHFDIEPLWKGPVRRVVGVLEVAFDMMVYAQVDHVRVRERAVGGQSQKCLRVAGGSQGAEKSAQHIVKCSAIDVHTDG